MSNLLPVTIFIYRRSSSTRGIANNGFRRIRSVMSRVIFFKGGVEVARNPFTGHIANNATTRLHK